MNMNSAEYFGEPVRFDHLLSAVFRRKKIIFLIVIVSLSAAIATFLSVTPAYRTEIILRVNPELNSIDNASGLSSTLGALDLLPISSSTDTLSQHLAILNSRAFLGAFLAERRLVGEASNYGRFVKVVPSRLKAAERFQSKIMEVEVDRLTGLVHLRIEWPNANGAAEMATALVERLNTHSRRVAVLSAERKLAYLSERLDTDLGVERRSLLVHLIQVEERKLLLAKGEPEFALITIDPAFIPENPSSPKILVYIFFGISIGIFLSIGIIWILPKGSNSGHALEAVN
ncbi:Wzz/FepE/Etk N-terminal domain-containing protein [uncultured Sphingosinicella sp.]|uniref:Wzz/FepE/Etk N-terminal domain-containing protein n=1 Tax=uncultured Sphingosinicella sp. TaxID=478748 RepID=UPI0030D91FDA|tara:strand:- start:23807 stop:24667 length:861 start_codon:yes stop_codon:yes gene_type:complete